MPAADTKTQLLDHAQDLVQRRGFNAFSFKDLAGAVQIKTASVHYHFPSKADLGVALIGRYQLRLEAELERIDARHRSPKARLGAFMDIYKATQQKGAICLCGSLAADLSTLPDGLTAAVKAYMDRNERWLKQTLQAGVAAGELELTGSAQDAATAALAALQGGLLLARANGDDAAVLKRVRRFLLKGFGA